MYGKIFEEIFNSTLVADGGWLPTYVFMGLITLADKHGIVEIAPRALYHRLGMAGGESPLPYDDFTQAIAYLEREDPESRSPAEDGKRIIPLSSLPEFDGNRGWFLVNYESYSMKQTREDQREHTAARVRRYRERQKKKRESGNADVTPSNASNDIVDVDVDVDVETMSSDTSSRKKKKREYSPDFEAAWAKKASRGEHGNPKPRAQKAWNARIKEGASPEDLTAGMERYAAYCKAMGKDPQFVMQAATFWGPDEHWKNGWGVAGNGEGSDPFRGAI